MNGDVRRFEAVGGGGLRLAGAESGPEDAPAILLIHGWSQAHLSWLKQLEGPLAERFRLVAFDLRGHGGSDKPTDAAAYQDSALWAEDVRGVMTARGLERPVLVGWSMGGWLIADYLRAHGDAAIAGAVFVGSTVAAVGSGAVAGPRPADVRAEGMYSANIRAQIDAAIAFAKACAAAPLSKRDLAFLTGLQMLATPVARKASRMRAEAFGPDLARLTRPALIIQGAADKVCARPMVDALSAALPGAERLDLPGVGHSPHWEAPERFDAALARFVEALFKT